MLVGCASATMETARGGKPTAQLDSHKAPELVAQCIQFSWQEEKVFGDDASGYLEPRKQGGFTVYTREAEAFVDVVPAGGWGAGGLLRAEERRCGPAAPGGGGDLPVTAG
ncbi:hypothetical protein PPS11_09723 [Pseudomonas putida S11]|nr:hypothetical protein PPS11_09723 [Pseudomonas putida S11]